MLFRLEDLDPERSSMEFADQMAWDLEWLGLDWDEGWRPGSGSFCQGLRNEKYESALEGLKRKGLIYNCYCSRAERLAASAPHPGEFVDRGCGCRALRPDEVLLKERQGRKAAKKMLTCDRQIKWDDGHFGPQIDEMTSGRDDFIVRRSDGVFAYQLAVSVDDMDMGVTRVVRARDLMASTARQIYLIESLGGRPPEYCHAPLLTAPNGRKLSKRDGDLNTSVLRERFTPEELVGILAQIAGLQEKPTPVRASDLIPVFSWDLVPKNDIVIPSELL